VVESLNTTLESLQNTFQSNADPKSLVDPIKLFVITTKKILGLLTTAVKSLEEKKADRSEVEELRKKVDFLWKKARAAAPASSGGGITNDHDEVDVESLSREIDNSRVDQHFAHLELARDVNVGHQPRLLSKFVLAARAQIMNDKDEFDG